MAQNTLYLTQIIEILRSYAPLKARDISKKLIANGARLEKSKVNSILYENENKYFTMDEDFSWSLMDTEKANENSNAGGFCLIGKIIQINYPIVGMHRGREWKKQDIIVISEKNNTELCFTVWQDQVDLAKLSVGERIKIQFDLKGKRMQNRIRHYLKVKTIEVVSESHKNI